MFCSTGTSIYESLWLNNVILYIMFTMCVCKSRPWNEHLVVYEDFRPFSCRDVVSTAPDGHLISPKDPLVFWAQTHQHREMERAEGWLMGKILRVFGGFYAVWQVGEYRWNLTLERPETQRLWIGIADQPQLVLWCRMLTGFIAKNVEATGICTEPSLADPLHQHDIAWTLD